MHGLISRKVYAVVPPKVEYSLTELGGSLVPRLRPLLEWCEGNLETVEAAKTRYALRQREPALTVGSA